MHNNFSHKPFAFLKEDTQEDSHGKKTLVFKNNIEKKSNTDKIHKEKIAQDNEEKKLFLQAMDNIPKRYTQHKNKHRANVLKTSNTDNFTALASIGDARGFSEIFPATNMPKKKKKSHTTRDNHIQNQNVQNPKLDATEEKELSMQELLAEQELRGKGLSNEDTEAFTRAMLEVNPLRGKGRAVAKCIEPNNAEAQSLESFASMMEKNVEFALSLKGEYLEGHVVGLDILTMDNLRSGLYSPEAHLDLHGLNAGQAYQTLITFFRKSWYKGMRTLLLVPGRGKNSPNGFAVLRDKLQLWLTQDPFKRVVLAFCTAKASDGGAGTMYVLLRKYKKKGKINWERLPADPDLY